MTINGPAFGLTLPQRGALFGIMTVPEMLELAAEADRSGAFGSVWVGDSLLAKPRPDAIALLGGLAAVTQRVRLGVGCMASFSVRDPVVFAYQWATLDHMSQGRMILAACTGIVKQGGASEAEGRVWGVRDRDRAARLSEFVDLCRRLWTEPCVTFEGTYCSLESVGIEPRPQQAPPPIWIAANPAPGPFFERSLRRVAEKADGWMSVRLRPDMLKRSWTALAGYLTEAGRDPSAFPTLAYHNININPDRQSALDESERFLREYYGPTFNREQVEAWTLAGDPKECAEGLRALFEEGAKHVTLRITSWSQHEQYRRLIDEVLASV